MADTGDILPLGEQVSYCNSWLACRLLIIAYITYIWQIVWARNKNEKKLITVFYCWSQPNYIQC